MTPSERERRIGGWPDGQAIPAPNVDRVRRQVMSNREADEAARYIEAMQERVGKLCDYVREAAGDESCIVPVALLNAIRERAERAEAAARDFAKALEEIGQGRSHPREPTDGEVARAALKRHPSFSGEEGTEE